MELKTHKLGTFEIVSGSVVVSDPCYDRGTWCSGKVDNVLNGSWSAITKQTPESLPHKGDHRDWDENRVAELIVYHNNYPNTDIDFTWSAMEFDVGVDSGQAGIFDDAHYQNAEDAINLGFKDTPRGSCSPLTAWYNLCCTTTCDSWEDRVDVPAVSQASNIAGVIPFGVVSSSGYGDGGYICFIKRNSDGLVVAIAIQFIDFDYDEEQEDEAEEA